MEITVHRDCPYYPCSFPEQSCRHCFCCLYPCRIEGTGGKYIETKTGHKIWDCTSCLLIHKQEIVELLDIDPNETDERVIREAKEKLKSYIRGE
jgi:Zn-finger protein